MFRKHLFRLFCFNKLWPCIDVFFITINFIHSFLTNMSVLGNLLDILGKHQYLSKNKLLNTNRVKELTNVFCFLFSFIIALLE